MKNYLLLIALFSTLIQFESKAQSNFCGTKLEEKDLSKLRSFQRNLDSGSFKKKAGITYVPIQFHILGNSSGVGYYKLETLLYTICELNKDFTATGFYFFMAGLPEYINDNELYRGDIEAVYQKAEDFKMPGVVNVFFQGTGNQWCGVYFPDVDVVFVLNRCQQTGSTTLTHELGHFFGLPHTFYGWEGGSDPGISFTEKLDGSNCRDAGDGFCDTKADYVSTRWDCPLAYNLKDPTGQFFKPDSSIYMSYSSDACQSRFSEEQMAAMNNDLTNRGFGINTLNRDTLKAPTPVFPLPADSNLNPKSIRFAWNAVPGAWAYYIQVARFGSWEFTNFETLVTDTFVDCSNLYGNWPYSYRLKAIHQGNACGDFSEPIEFTTRELATGNQEIRINSTLGVYPNPVVAGNAFQVLSQIPGILQLFDSKGALLVERNLEAGIPFQFKPESNGIYIGKFESQDGVQVFRVLVNSTL
ncbi:MAG: zinc-dependent metalloprotease [Bacteroidetes bacterium]|nr:zinc-dependent metalloprotease [Bacteroidota bacterium]